jgi:Flp pilus assembly secretin CpaC
MILPMKKQQKIKLLPRLALGLSLLFAAPVGLLCQSTRDMETVQIFLGESEKIPVSGLTRVIISDPNVVEVIVPTTELIVLNAKTPGTAILTLFERDKERMIRILVVENNVALAMRIKAAIGYPNVRVIIAEQNIILEGDVQTQDERNRAVTIASAFLPAIRSSGNQPQNVSNVFNNTTYPAADNTEGDVADASSYSVPTPEGIIDFLRVTNPLQIRLRIQVVRISSNALKDFGLRFAEQANYGVGYTETITGPGTGGIGSKPWLGDQLRTLVHGLVIPQGSEVGYSVALRTLENQGKAKTLARPVITTLDGAEASFLAGGKVILNSSTVVGGQLVTSTFTEEVGVKVFFRPKVMPNGNINLFVTPKVADPPISLDSQGSVFIASRNTRNNVEMRSGDTMVLAGLFSIDESVNINKLPWLADIPIIGELFRNRVRRGGSEEVMFLVTPEIVRTPSLASIGPDMPTELGETKVFLQEQRAFSSMAPDVLPYGNPSKLSIGNDESLFSRNRLQTPVNYTHLHSENLNHFRGVKSIRSQPQTKHIYRISEHNTSPSQSSNKLSRFSQKTKKTNGINTVPAEVKGDNNELHLTVQEITDDSFLSMSNKETTSTSSQADLPQEATRPYTSKSPTSTVRAVKAKTGFAGPNPHQKPTKTTQATHTSTHSTSDSKQSQKTDLTENVLPFSEVFKPAQ